MSQIKIFYAYNSYGLDELEKRVNEFIQRDDIIFEDLIVSMFDEKFMFVVTYDEMED